MALFEAGLVLTQLLTFLHDLGASLDAGNEIDVIYLDFSKAFNSVPHGKLLHKLSLFGIQGPYMRGLPTTLIQDLSRWSLTGRSLHGYL